MAEQKSFKERVKETVIQNAYSYKKYFVDYEYLLCSTAFVKSEYYIVSAHEDNYLHLTGLHTSLNAAAFFEKCYAGGSRTWQYQNSQIKITNRKIHCWYCQLFCDFGIFKHLSVILYQADRNKF